jgi:hypothetical protein
LVVDTLDALLSSAKDKGRIKGLVPHLLEGGVTDLHYGNVIIMMIQKDEENILNQKFILCYFENMSEMKINHHKSEVHVIVGDQHKKEEIAVKFNSKLGNFPMTDLGISINIRKLRKQNLKIVNYKMNKRTYP